MSALSGASGSPGRRRQSVDDGLEHVLDADAFLGRAQDRAVGVEPEVVLDLGPHPLDVGRRQVDLVDHRHDLEVVLERQVEVGDGLRLDPLRGVDQQQRALAGHQRAPHLVREVDVTGGVDQVEMVAAAVARHVVQRHRVRLDGDAALALDVHRVQDLVAEVARLDRPAVLDQAVGERRLAVVDVRDDAEGANVVQQRCSSRRARRRGSILWAIPSLRDSGRVSTVPASASAPASVSEEIRAGTHHPGSEAEGEAEAFERAEPCPLHLRDTCRATCSLCFSLER